MILKALGLQNYKFQTISLCVFCHLISDSKSPIWEERFQSCVLQFAEVQDNFYSGSKQ